MKNGSFKVSWSGGEFTVLRQGAMCAPVNFFLPNGKTVQPFMIAPWENDASGKLNDLPQILKKLRGEWVCVPFGMPEKRKDLPKEWSDISADKKKLGNWFHGPSSNENWVETERIEGGIKLEIEYPTSHPIKKLVRTIVGSENIPRLNFELEIHARENCFLPIGIHPVFRVPTEPGFARLLLDGDISVHTYPVEAEIGVSQFPLGSKFPNLENCSWSDGLPLDLSSHPLERHTEEIVLVSGVSGCATLENLSENYKVSVFWDKEAFANCNLWISNYGRKEYPWNGRFQALGIEPVSAPFDLGYEVANTTTNPLLSSDVKCGVQFKANQVWTTKYAIEVKSI